MIKDYLKLLDINLKLFDEEGTGEPGALADGTDQPVDSQQAEKSDKPVVYGKQDEQKSVQEKDNDTAGSNDLDTQNQKVTPPEDRAETYKNFKSEYKDEFAEDFQQHFNQRFKQHKQLEEQVQTYEPVVEALMKFHNAKDVNELMKIVDNEVVSELADQEGMSVEAYKRMRELEQENKQYKEEKQNAESDSHFQEIVNDWIKQEGELKKTVPDFELNKATKNEKFKDLIGRGVSVSDAYFLTNKDKILKDTAKKVEESTTQNIQAKGTRIKENGTQKAPGVIYKTDVNKLTAEDREEIARRVSEGEVIKF